MSRHCVDCGRRLRTRRVYCYECNENRSGGKTLRFNWREDKGLIKAVLICLGLILVYTLFGIVIAVLVLLLIAGGYYLWKKGEKKRIQKKERKEIERDVELTYQSDRVRNNYSKAFEKVYERRKREGEERGEWK